MSESHHSEGEPQFPSEKLDMLAYDFRIAGGEVILSPDEAWEIRKFIRGVDDNSPYRPLYLDVDEQYLRGWPTEAPIRLGEDRVIALVGSYIGMLWDTDKADTMKIQELKYKIDRLSEQLPEAQQEAIKQQLESEA
ncbi:MAG: hypothetical protein M3Q36_01360 [bacterium]|nr:hypothetical protein [bacterium]